MEEKYKIHAGYLFSILVLIIIGLITVKWSEISNLSGYLTFALTVSSLVLSVVAIFYTVYSNAGFAGKLTELNNASRSISDAATGLSRASLEIREKVEGISPLLKDVGEKVEQTHIIVKSFSEIGSTPLKEKGEQKGPEALFAHGSFNGLTILYACSLSFEKKAPFDLAALCKQLKNVTFDYSYGYLVASWGQGVLHSQQKGIVNVLAFPDEISRRLKPELERRLAKFSAATKEAFAANLATVEAYFNVSATTKKS